MKSCKKIYVCKVKDKVEGFLGLNEPDECDFYWTNWYDKNGQFCGSIERIGQADIEIWKRWVKNNKDYTEISYEAVQALIGLNNI